MLADSPTLMLENENQIIAKVIGAAPVLADRLEAGQAVEGEILQGVVEFMRIFADQCHHDKEEALLFPLLGKKGVPMQGYPVGALTMEHGMGRMLVKGLAYAAQAYEEGAPVGKQAVVQALRGIAELYPSYIWKEDNILFLLTNEVLSLQEQQSLHEQFVQVEQRVGQDVHQRLELFADQLSEHIQAG